jgi:hypothetical protein
VPFDPHRRLAVVRHAPSRSRNARRCLQRTLPESWRFASQIALDLARQVEHLAWAGRSEIFDVWFLRQAETLLGVTGVNRLISGEPAAVDSPGTETVEERRLRFGTWSRAVITAVLAELPEERKVGNPQQALTHLLSGELHLARTAAGWTAEHGVAPLQHALRELPGYALVLLAASPNDTAERFMARDAFWAAVMKRS